MKKLHYFLAFALLLALIPSTVLAAAPAPRQVVVSSQYLEIDGVRRNPQRYNIDGYNYFKLRDMAYLLNGTGSQFSVGWDAASSTVSIITGRSYNPNGKEMITGVDRSSTAVPSRQIILIDGERRSDLFVYNIGDENYFKLRDLGDALFFKVSYDAASRTAVVETMDWYESDYMYDPDDENPPDFDFNPEPDAKPETKPLPETELEPETNPETETKPQPETIPETGSESWSAEDEILTVGDKDYHTGMTVQELTDLAGQPDETLASIFGFTWYVFGSNDYLGFFAAGAQDGKVVRLVSGGKAFSYMGLTAGDTVSPSNGCIKLYFDNNDGGILHAVMLSDEDSFWGEWGLKEGTDTSAQALYGESKMNFHMTNAFRVFHGLKPFVWSDAAAEASRLHSQDMADNNYFSHSSLDGRSPWERMKAQGLNYSKAAENISAGRALGIDVYDSWVNSFDHRQNMLGNCMYLGVGAGYDSSSYYRWYMTQDFYTPW